MTDLAELVDGSVRGDGTVMVRDLTHDSRQAGPGTLFVAVPGSSYDGHDFVDVAIAAGSPAVVVERDVEAPVTRLVVADTRAVMAKLAAAIHRYPSRDVQLVGVTGTNGKTTVTHMLEAIGGAAEPVGLIGTVHTRVGDLDIPNVRTTPEAPDFQRLLRRMADAGARVVAAEVSSHALELGRVDESVFAVAAFTNLTQDHLDFHGGMEEYFAAKARLFTSDRSRHAVVFVDDPHGRQLARSVSIPVTTVGRGGEIVARRVESEMGRSRFFVETPMGARRMSMGMGGRFNVDNALVAIGCALALDMDLDTIAQGLATFGGVPGRFELVSGDDPIRVVVDYAHTPAGIGEAIATARATGAVRVIVVVGAGGDRDRAKRPQMGSQASKADLTVITSDNPRSEDPEAIINEVIAGIRGDDGIFRHVDRRAAIEWAVSQADEGDVVLVLGRGHERGQEVDGRAIPFDDRLVARDALARRREAEL